MNLTLAEETRIEEILQNLTLEEKVSLCHANSLFTSTGVERMGITELVMSDGPHGVRPEFERGSWDFIGRDEDACTYLPTGSALAATWNPELGKKFGETLGSEARYRGKDIILGPSINIIRTPLGGRNFEYMSEDPCLIEKLVPGLIQGIQTQDVAACVKHFVLNNQELDRGFVNVDVSRRALHEIYLKGFRAAVKEGGVASVMGAYNRYEMQHCCHNHYLVNEVLKGEWEYDGVFVSDWAGTHDTPEAIYNGLDIEMGTPKPYEEYYLADAFLEMAKDDEEVQSILDDKVRRILRLMTAIHKDSPERKEGSYNTKEHQKVAFDIAAEAMVLLKNEDGLLPIVKSKAQKILVVGPNADEKHASGGNSSGVSAYYEITPLQGIVNRLSKSCEIIYDSGKLKAEYRAIPVQVLNIIDTAAGCRAFKQISYDNDGELQGTVLFTEDGRISNGQAKRYEVQFSLNVPADGAYSLRICSNCNVQMKVNGEVMHMPYTQGMGELVFKKEYNEDSTLDVELQIDNIGGSAELEIGWITPLDAQNTMNEEELLETAKKVDYVIYCGGLNHSYDCESFDKKDMYLPKGQDDLISKLLKANGNTIIAITAGSPVEMPWIEDAKAVIWTWYAGMETGHVLCDILTGEINPSGKMPFTLPKTYEDTPVARYGEYKEVNCRYNEDIFVGYRGYDYDDVEPMFPFGHGLSYSTFEYSDLNICVGEQVMVEFKLTNAGPRTAKEIAQVYIGDPICSVKRPVKELRNFAKVSLEPGESQVLFLPITREELMFYDEKTQDWKLESGKFAVYVGASSRDIRLSGTFQY